MSSPRSVLNETFFQQLWPLILERNICDTKSQRTIPYFRPKRHFDALWAHGFLASKCYGEYEPPISFYYPCAWSNDESIVSSPKRVPLPLDQETEECGLNKENCILTLDQQFAELGREQKRQQQLSDDFKNRSIPWYAPRSHLDKEFSEDIRKVFVKPFERFMLHAIHSFDCKFIIINVGNNNSLAHIENWLKFCKYVKIILIVRKRELAKRLSRLNPALYPVLFQEFCENTWQEELTRALNVGICVAVQANIMTNCAMAFAFVFSSRSDLDAFNKYKILRKL